MARGPWLERSELQTQSVLGLPGIDLGGRKAQVWCCFTQAVWRRSGCGLEHSESSVVG